MGKYSFDAVIFDLDGVITKTAIVHSKAWKATFDEYLRMREKRDGEPFKEFTKEGDYLPYVDGKPRYKGVQSFLESRDVNIPFGEATDAPDKETSCGIGNRKNEMFLDIIEKEGAEIYPSTIALIRSLSELGIRVGVASSSKSCKLILESCGIEDLFETRVDGVVSTELGLKGKPEGDIFVTAAANVGAIPSKSVVVEDATSGVQAGRNGEFGLVLGVARENNESELLENGADLVVSDLAQISIKDIEKWFKKEPVDLFKSWDQIDKDMQVFSKEEETEILVNPYYQCSAKSLFADKKKMIFFLDYDGTLTPIVERPDLAVMSDDMRDTVKQLSSKHTVAIVSGRMRQDVENLVKIQGIFYAGSHGFDINGPDFSMVQPKAEEVIGVVASIIEQFRGRLKDVEGALIEEKKFSVAVHYRLVKEQYLRQIKEVVDDVVGQHKDAVRLMSGKKVFEILPNIEWDKGKAIRWIMKALNFDWSDNLVVYIGDDVTDEYAFRAVRARGIGVLVSDEFRASAADFILNSPNEVKRLFTKVLES